MKLRPPDPNRKSLGKTWDDPESEPMEDLIDFISVGAMVCEHCGAPITSFHPPDDHGIRHCGSLVAKGVLEQ